MTRRTSLLLLSIGVGAPALLAYANHFDNEFHFDDSHVIQDNAAIRDLGNIPRFFTDGTTGSVLPTNAGHRPVLMATFALDL